MPIEVLLLAHEPYPVERCPICALPFRAFLRGQVQRSKRFLGVLWPRPYCAVICQGCKQIVGWEAPPGGGEPAAGEGEAACTPP